MKMTKEQLRQARNIADTLNADGTSTVHRLLAHIDALDAEHRAELERERNASMEYEKELKTSLTRAEGEAMTLAGTLKTESAERVRCREGRAASEARALDMERQRDEVRAAWDALMVRVTDHDGLSSAARMGEPGWQERIISYIIGEGLRPAVAVEGVSNSPSNSEPGTEEAFDTLHAFAEGLGRAPDYVHAVDLLKRRMGALERAIRDLREVAFTGPSAVKGSPGGESYWDWKERIRRETDAALTGAPPVFTRQDVTQAMHDAGIPLDGACDVLERLTAMRRKETP